MYPHSARMDDAVRNGTGALAVGIAVLENGQQISVPTLNIVGGNVITDVGDSRPKRATLELIAEDGALVPDEARDLFSPAEARNFVPSRGFRYSDGTTELIPQGSLVVTGVDAELTTEGVRITITGEDDSLRVSDAKYVQAMPSGLPPGYVAPGQDYADVLRAIWMDRFQGAGNKGVIGPASGFLTPRTIPQDGQDPWELMRQFASAIGWRLLPDNNGVLTMGPIPDPYAPNAAVVWTFHDDGSDEDNPPITTKVAPSVKRDGIYSGAKAVGSNSFGLTPPAALVWDTDPNSPTYYLGAFGMKPFIRQPDEKITTFDMATASATGELNARKGVPQVVTINHLVHPAMTVDDIIRCDFDRAGVAGLYAFDHLEMPLSVGDVMTSRCRERRLGA